MTALHEAANIPVDNLVIGGGLAGSMAALHLAAAGRSVTLIEKARSAHHKVCGEFLSEETVDYLRQVGVDPLSLGATAIRFMRFSVGRRVVEFSLPFTALALSRFTLDEAMLHRVQVSGCRVMRGLYVDGLTRTDDTWSAQIRETKSNPESQPNSEPHCLPARTVFLACGKHDLRGQARAHSGQSDLVAFKMYWSLKADQTRALRDCIELFLFPGGYGGFCLVERDQANLCLVVRQDRLRTMGGWRPLLVSLLQHNQLLSERLQGAKSLWDRPLALSSIPYGYLSRGDTGLWCVGDQSAVIPSFTGDGMAIALHSAALAVDMCLSGKSPDQFSALLRKQLSGSMSLATRLSRAMVTGVGRRLAPVCASLAPRAMGWIATSTRIPIRARVAPHEPSQVFQQFTNKRTSV